MVLSVPASKHSTEQPFTFKSPMNCSGVVANACFPRPQRVSMPSATSKYQRSGQGNDTIIDTNK